MTGDETIMVAHHLELGLSKGAEFDFAFSLPVSRPQKHRPLQIV